MDHFPELPCAGNRVDARRVIEPGTASAVVKGYIFGSIAFVFLILVTYGIALIGVLLYPFVSWYQHRKAMALIHGSGIKLSDGQFPQIHQVVETYSKRLGIEVPDVYIVESNVINAFAVRFGKRNVILLTDDIINACIVADKPSALSYVVGHELGHIALGHNSLIRSFITSRYKHLARLDEYSADRVAASLVESRSDALAGLIILTVGPQLAKYINGSALKKQIDEVAKNKYSKKAERTLTHPLLLNRIRKIGSLPMS